MKKILTLLLLGTSAVAANAQQINGDFDADWHNCTPWSSDGNKTEVGAEPFGWHVSNVYAAGSKVAVSSCVPGNGTKQAVKLTNQGVLGQKIPAYLTLGTPWATAQVKGIGTIKEHSTDGGAFGGVEFTYHPDAISFDYKRDNTHGTENATVVAYLWNGSWTQKDVPGNTAFGLFGFPDPTLTDMVDRDRNVLGKEKTDAVLGGDVTKTDGATKVASLEQAITENTGDEWKSMTVEFNYGDNASAKVEKFNVIFSANNYFGDRNDIVKDNSLTVDNVKLVYYHALSSLVPQDNDGNDVDIKFNPEVFSYNVNSTYDEDFTEVNYTKKGVGATVEAAYNDETAQYVITVKGEDYNAETNPSAMTVYTIQYLKAAPTLSSLVVAGHEFLSAGVEGTSFTATGHYYADELSYKVADSDEGNPEATANYDESSKTLTVRVSQAGCPDNVYTIKFEDKEKDAVYQIPNSDFNSWTEADVLSEGWNSFESASGTLAYFASMSPKPQKIEDGKEGNGVRLTSSDLFVACANGNLTTGHINMGSTDPADASNFNYTDRTDVNGNLPFAGKPDAFEVYARFTPGTKSTHLPADQDVTFNGRVQIILHSDAAYHDPELDSQVDDKIASASAFITPCEKWTKFTGEFNYLQSSYVGQQYVLASATTNPVPGASMNDQLDLDELRLVYYHSLSSLSFDGKPVEGFNSETTQYTLNADIEEADNVEYVVNGVAATAEKSINGNVLTITVYGDDYSVNPESKTVYTVKFEKIVDSINNITAEDAKSHEVYTLGGVRVSGKPAAGLYIVDGKKTTIK